MSKNSIDCETISKLVIKLFDRLSTDSTLELTIVNRWTEKSGKKVLIMYNKMEFQRNMRSKTFKSCNIKVTIETISKILIIIVLLYISLAMTAIDVNLHPIM